ncbi:MAG: hypothetical protein CL920_17860 [Deltaproteobacteria bacterium]|nr:hypothetical protein [Deltaproteobacteria bacterium]
MCENSFFVVCMFAFCYPLDGKYVKKLPPVSGFPCLKRALCRTLLRRVCGAMGGFFRKYLAFVSMFG